MSSNKARAQFEINHEASDGTSTSMTPVAIERDPEFYYEDSPVVIQVENTMFSVHKYHLIKSDIFSDMFSMPKGPNKGSHEGASPEHPIVLSGVKSSDFRALLKVLYAVDFSDQKLKREPEIIVPAFRLAHMWNFSDLRTHLLPLARDALGCVDKIVLARELGIQEWLAPAHVELCQRIESLTMDEVRKLGIDSTVMILRLREQPRPSQSAASSGSTADYCGSCLKQYYVNYEGSTCCRCSRYIDSPSYRIPGTPASTAPPSDAEVLESQVKKWVEGGCVTE